MTGTAEQVLQAIIATADCCTPTQISDATGLDRARVKHSLELLTRQGLATTPRRGCYRATEAAVSAGREPVRPGPRRGVRQGWRPTAPDKLTARAWRVMRQLRKATLAEVIELAGAGERTPRATLLQYFGRLVKAGYLAVLPRSHPRRYVLLRDTGPAAPSWSSRRGTLLDQNTGDEVTL